ncbi:MAG: NAD(P)-dependent oxidoreductase [Zavarzinella sp.]|nr:NAD(P)-dependent oxidoreductase [Zavarzinella sp.]
MTDHILVTGSAGRVGQAAVKGLVAAGLPVVGFDMRPTPGLPVDRSIVGTLADGTRFDKIAAGARCIIHLAATPDDARYPRGPAPDDADNFESELVPNNIVGTYRVMEAARKGGVPRVILASTGQVIFGQLQAGRIPVRGDTPPEPRYLYACTKVFLEALGRAYSREHGIEVMAVRLGWCPRPGQEEEIRQSDLGPDVYLSPADAGRFFVAAVTVANVPPFSILYATSRPAKRLLYDLSETTRVTGYVPQETWPTGLSDY